MGRTFEGMKQSKSSVVNKRVRRDIGVLKLKLTVS
jgi:hypothetical protein